MTTGALLGAAVWLGDIAVHDIGNSLQLETGRETQDATTFTAAANGARINRAGLKTAQLSASGFADFDGYDADLESLFDDASATVVSVSETGGDGDVAYTFESFESQLSPIGGSVGDMDAVSVTAMARSGVGAVRGTILHPESDVSGAANGTGRQLGTVAAGEKLYTSIHALSVGTTVDVIVESDGDSGFGTPTTRSSTTVTAEGATWVAPVDGAIGDDWWRVRFANVTGTSRLAVIVGIA